MGAIWLTFTIISVSMMSPKDKHKTTGTVQEIITTDWSGFKDTYAMIQTNDGQGTVLIGLYSKDHAVGDVVDLDISTGGFSKDYIYASLSRD